MNVLNAVNSVAVTTNDNTLDEGSILKAWNSMSVAFTVTNSGNETLDYEVVAGNESDLSDAVIVQASAALTSGSVGSYAIQVSPFSYYGINLQSSAPDTPSEATILGRAKG